MQRRFIKPTPEPTQQATPAKPLSQTSDDELRELGARAWVQCFGKKSNRLLLELLTEKSTKPAPKGGAL